MKTMIDCGECGKENDAGSKFCIYCGAVIREEKGVPDRKKVKKGLIAALAAGLILIVGIGSFVYFTGDTYNCKKAMRLAEKYYEEEDYKDALHYYEEALELDGTLVEAYLKSADIYMTEEKYEDALKRVKEGGEKTGSEDMDKVLAKVYQELVDQYMEDEKYEEALEIVKEGIEETKDKGLLERRSELYVLLADVCAEAGDEGGELQILGEAIEATGEAAFIERRDIIYQRQADELEAKELEAIALEAKAIEEETDEQEDILRTETDEEYFEEVNEAEEGAKEETILAKLNSNEYGAEPAPNGYSIADFAGKETKMYEWDGVERKVRDNVGGKVYYDYREKDFASYSDSKVDKESEQLFMYILVELMNELGVAGTDTFSVTKCEDMNGYLVTDADIYKVEPRRWEGGPPPVIYIRIGSSNVAYSYPSDVTPN